MSNRYDLTDHATQQAEPFLGVHAQRKYRMKLMRAAKRREMQQDEHTPRELAVLEARPAVPKGAIVPG